MPEITGPTLWGMVVRPETGRKTRKVKEVFDLKIGGMILSGMPGLLLLLLPVGCASSGGTEQTVRPEIVTAELSDAARTEAEKYVEGFAAALKSGDYGVLEAVLPTAEGRRQVSREMFDSLRGELEREYGKLVDVGFFGELDQTLVRDYYWAFTFERRVESAERSGAVSRVHLLYLVRVGSQDGRPVITGAGFRI